MAKAIRRATPAWADPPGATERWHSERLMRLPASLWCYRPWEASPAVGASPAASRGHVTFGSTNTLAMQANDILAMTRLNEFNERAEAEKKNARQKTGLRRFLRKRPSLEKPPET